MNQRQSSPEHTFSGTKLPGFAALAFQLFLLVSIIYVLVNLPFSAFKAIYLIVITISFFIFSAGYLLIEPNNVRVLTFFGKYVGTIKDNGFFWINPLITKTKLTLRARNQDIAPIKVNDKAGNPVMIGLMLVWRVKDTYKAMFDIDNQGANLLQRMSVYQNFVSVQSDAALRNLAGEYAYDNNEVSDEVTLRSGGELINDRLEVELNERLDMAGIEVVEARINYLAYAPEIAAIMLRRQQATAIIAAREKIVEGAVGMVQLALDKLATDNIVDLDDDKKAAMVSNLLVVLCGEDNAQPIVNTGTLHQ